MLQDKIKLSSHQQWLKIPTLLYCSPLTVPSDPVSNLTAQIFSSTAIIVSWDPPTEPNGRPYYILTLQEAGRFSNMTSPGAPAVNKTTKHTTTDNVFLFTKLRKYFPYVLTVTPATSAGAAYNQTSTVYLRTDDDSEFLQTAAHQEAFMYVLQY